MFHSRVQELAQAREWGPYDIVERTSLSLNTAKHWLYVRKMRQVNFPVVIELCQLFDLDDWRKLFYPTVIDAVTDKVMKPNDPRLANGK